MMPEEAQPNTSVAQPEAPPPAAPPPAVTPPTPEPPKEKTFFKRWDQKSGQIEELPSQLEDAPPAEATPAEAPKEPAAPPKLWANKYKTPEEMEKGYIEAEKMAHTKAQEAAEAKRQLEAKDKVATAQTATEINEKMAAKEAEKVDWASLLIENPENFEQVAAQRIGDKVIERINLVNDTQKIMSQWEKDNPDLAGVDGSMDYVGIELTKLLRANPERMNDDRTALLNEATGRVRQKFQTIGQQAVAIDRTVRTSVQPLAVSAGAHQREQTPAVGAPQSTVDPVQTELAARRREHQRVTGQLPVRR